MKAPYFYTSLENQIRDDGSQGLLYQHFIQEDDETPEQLYERALANIDKQTIAYELIQIIREDGICVASEILDNRITPEPEPEPQPEPNE